MSVSSTGQLDAGTAAGRRVERRVHVTVLRLGAAAKRLEIRQAADHRMRAALGDAAGLLVVADERGHVVPGAHERVENGGADIARRSSQKDPHRGCVS
jgi:hypothetical protein